MPTSRSASRATERDLPRERPPRRWPLILVGVLVVSAAAIFVLPASMITRFLPAQVRAEDFSGTLIHGAAGKIFFDARDIGALEWHLHPLSLLRLAAVADVHWVMVGFVTDGTAEISARGIAAHDVRGNGPIESLVGLGVAPGWHGTANLAFSEIKSDFVKLIAAVGKVEVSNVSASGIAEGSDLGGYLLQIPAGAVAADGSIRATLKDTGGPVELQAEIRLSPSARTALLSGTLMDRPEASQALRNQLAGMTQLRPRDSSGRFPVELEFRY
jgi:Type II secretion system (T2SS), protein N